MARASTRNIRFDATGSHGAVSGVYHRPANAWALFVLAHGAGAGYRHPFMETVAKRLGESGVATLRYHFPYRESGRNRPDAPAVLQQTVRSAVEKAAGLAPDLPLIAGGKSLGGRMTSMAFSSIPLPGVRGIAFLGFPLHAPRRPSDKRAEHLAGVRVPMLFVQGTRDDLADLTLMRPVCERLGPLAELHVVDGGDHSFKVLKRSGRTEDDVMDEIQGSVAIWARTLVG